MGMNIRWIHFILFLVLALGGYSGLWGAPFDPYANPKGLPSFIEPASKKNPTPATKEVPAICYKVNPDTGRIEKQSGCTVYFFNGYDAYTGGHHHYSSSGRTKGQSIPGPKSPAGTRADSISVLSFTGEMETVETYLGKAQVGRYEGTKGFPFKIHPSQVGQDEWIRACNGPPNQYTGARNCKTHEFSVKYSDLKNYRNKIIANSKMIDLGATGTHPHNHNGTQLLWTALTKIAQEYHNKFSCYKEYDPIAINDMALPYGGVFDINNDWRGPHYSHHRGKAVDIRCKTGLPNSVIYDKDIINEFLAICDKHKLKYARHELEGTKNEHCHCGINGDGE